MAGGGASRGSASLSFPEIVAITSLASGGAGVGKLSDGMTVFVPRSAPGDRVRLARLRRRKRHAEAQLAELIEGGPARVDPVCEHFTRDRCGGCQWQHLAIEVQREAKRRIVGDALRRIARLDVSDPELVPSPNSLGYRSTVTLTVRRAPERTWAGFHDAADPDRVFALDRCHIADPRLQALWEAVRGALDCLPDGDDVRLKLRVAADGGLHVVVSGGASSWTGADGLASAASLRGLAATIWWEPARGVARHMAGPHRDPAAASFAQVNSDVAAALKADLLAEARRHLGPEAGKRALDLYAGAGDTALELARMGFDVTMVELDRRAVRRAEELAAAGGVELRCVAGRVEDHIQRLLPADIVVANPPRTGLGEAVTDHLNDLPPSRLIYVSCDSATLARDLSRLRIQVEDLELVRCYDMFPQTSHVETLCVLAP